MGFSVLRIQLRDIESRRTLQVMIERLDGEEITVEDCADASYTASAILDVEDPIQGNYDLQVSSPGMARPLVSREDFDKYAGYEIKVEMQSPVGGRKRFRGKLLPSDGELIQLQFDNEIAQLPYADMLGASLVQTEDMIREHLRASKKQADKKLKNQHPKNTKEELS